MKNRLLVLMGEKQAKENRPINGAVVAREIGLTRQAINKWVNEDIKEFSADTIDRLCEYFDCEVGDLLYRVKNQKSQQLQ